jgi:uncharacterized Fe-S cluster protein YjdI
MTTPAADFNAAQPEPWPGKAYEGRRITIYFDAERCRHFAECVRGLPQVFDVQRRPWILPDAAEVEELAQVIRRCPSGALHYVSEELGPEQPDVPTTLTPLEGGPLLVRGNLLIVRDGGTLQETRADLCRCGRSARQPFCDATCSD